MTDKRKTGEGAMKGWATRRKRQQDRRDAVNVLIDVADSITGELMVGLRATEYPGKFLVGALIMVSWRDRIEMALRSLDRT